MSTKKTITPLDLREQNYFLEFTTSQNPYLGITGLDDIVSSGRYSFLINGSKYLKEDSVIRFEAIDSEGNLIFISGIRNLLRGTARVVSFEVNDDIKNGIAKIYVSAILATYDDNGEEVSVPDEFLDTENILLTHTFQIDKTRVNTDEIIFRRPPQLSITPTLRKVRTILKPTVTSSTITADIREYQYDSSRSKFELKIESRDNDIVLDMDNSPITITNTPIDIEGGIINVTGLIKQGILTIPNPDIEKYGKEDFKNLLQSPITFTVRYDNFTQYNLVKLQEAAFADVVISNMETVSGDVEKIKIFGKSDTLKTDYNLLSEYDLIAKNLLDIEGTGDIGIFDTSDKLNSWSVSKIDSGVSNPTIAIDNTRLLSAVTVQGDYDSPQTKEVNGKLLQKPRYKLESNTSLSFYKNIEYKIKLNAALINSPSTFDTRCDVYIQGTSLDGDVNQYGKLLGSLRSNKNYIWENEFETTFTNSSDVTDGKIIFVITSGQWILQKIQIESELQQGFSPQEFRVQVPVDVKKNQQDIDFIVEFFDANNNKAETFLREDNVIFDRPNLVIEGFDNFLSGSLFVGEATSSGIGLGLSDAGGAFIKSVPYDGFIDATTGGQSGFLLYSGSVTSSVEDEYSGSLGVEIVKDEDNYLRFRTEPSLFEVKSDVFFFGNADTQFISGSNSNIEISASNFHLDPKNDILIIKGAIRQDTNGVELTDFRNRGVWSAGVIYLNNDLVQYDVSGKTQTYIAVNDHTSSVSDPNGPPEPDASNNWEIFAASGDDGTDGADGSDGADGADGDPGPGVVFRGEYDTTGATTYFASTTRRDVVEGSNGQYYLCKLTHTGAADKEPITGGSYTTYWETFGATFSSVATDILFAQDVYANRTINIGSDGGNPVIALDSDFGNSGANPSIKINSSGYNTNGIFLGYDSSTAKLSLKSGTNSLLWDGTNLNINGGGTFSGNLSAAGGTFTGTLSAATGTFTGQVTAGTSVVLGDNVDGGGNDGIYLGANNYWYDGGTFEVGNGTEGVSWNGSSLDITGNIKNGATAFQTGTGFFADDSGNFYVGENGDGISLNASTNEVTIYDYEFSTIFGGHVFFNNVSTPLVNPDESPNRAAFMHVTRYNDSSSTLRTGFLLQSYGEGTGGNTDIIPIALVPHQRNDLLNNSTAWYFNKNLRFLIANDGAGYIGWETEGDHRITGDLTVNNDVDVTGTVDASLIRSTGDVIAFYSSDERLKDNIIPLRNATDKIKQIGGYEFDWNDKQNIYEGHDVGVIAQEVEKVLPEVVETRDSGYKAVKYEKIVPLLIESIKELTSRIEELETKLSEQ